MRIVTGSLKGRTVPFNPRKHGDIRVTSTRLKEAVFSILGPLQGSAFLDLCAGSGQIALEAYSRGAHVTACEADSRRYRYLKNLLGVWEIDERLQLFHGKAQMAIAQQRRSYVGVYIDPPYDAALSGCPASIALAEQVARAKLLDDNGLLFVQHSSRLAVPDTLGCLHLDRERSYGDTVISVYTQPTAVDELT